MTRHGKIARLPEHIREQINRRLQDGENGRQIIAWLNAMDEVKAVLARQFEGRPINDGNLSEWKLGGHRDWQTRQAVLTEARRAVAEGGALADSLAVWMLGRYIVATRKLIENADDPEAWKLTREICHDLVALRRGDHGAEWLRIERERLKLQRKKQKCERKKLKQEIRKENPPRPAMSDKEKERAWNEIFGINPDSHPMCQNRNPFEADAVSEPSEPPQCAPETPAPVAAPPPEPDPEAMELRKLMEWAESGHAYSAYCLGARYRDGFGVAKDLAKAREWLGKAAGQGIGSAKIELHALMMRSGIEV
jgi:hypothetical protein